MLNRNIINYFIQPIFNKYKLKSTSIYLIDCFPNKIPTFTQFSTNTNPNSVKYIKCLTNMYKYYGILDYVSLESKGILKSSKNENG